MYKVFIKKKFWVCYLAFCIGSFALAIFINNLYGLAGQSLLETSHQNIWLLTFSLMLPPVLIPGFLLIGLIEKLKKHATR